MNYITLLNRFWELNDTERFTPCETMVYFYLLRRFNEAKWPEQLAVSTEQTTLGTGISKMAVINSRRRLAEAGLIDVSVHKKGRGSCSVFVLKNVYLNGKKSDHLIRHLNAEKVQLNGKKCYHFSKEEIPPTPPKEEIYNIPRNKQEDNLASLDSGARTHTRMSEMSSVELLRMHFTQCMARESLMMNFRIDEQQYRELTEQILSEWQISEGDNFTVDVDRKRHFINLLRIKADSAREKGGARSRQECRQELLATAVDAVNNALNGTDYIKQEDDAGIGF